MLAEQGQGLVGRDGVERDRRGLDEIESLGDPRDGLGVEHHEVGLGPVLADHVVIEPGDQVTGREPRHTRPDLDDDAGDVPAEAEPTTTGDGTTAGLGGHEHVDRVDGRGCRPDEHLPGSGTQVVDLDDLRLVVTRD